MLTGVLPFNGTTAARLATQHLREAPDLRPLPSNQQPIIARALSKDPQQRFGTCTELVEELAAAVRRGASVKEELPFVRESLLKANPSAPHSTPTDSPQAASEQTRSTAKTTSQQSPSATAAPANASALGPTIVIGIGGTAGKALQRMRLRMNDRIGSVTSIPQFKMLFLDVDQDSLNEINRDQQAWSELETIPTPLRNSAEYREQGHLHRRWLSRRWLFNVPRNLRTDGLRPLGRLALMSNTNKVVGAIRAAIAQVTTANPASPSMAQPRVMLVASIAGGTGSGMLLDLAYCIRHELQSAGFPQGTVHGVLLHSMPIGTGRDKALLNAVATLRELEHYSAPGSFYPGEALLKTPPFHGNNQTFETTQLMHLGEDLETADWLRAIDHVAEHLYCRLMTPLDEALSPEQPVLSGVGPAIDLVQTRQIGGYSGNLVHELTRQLCVDVINDWCGSDLDPQAGDGRTTPAATLILNAMENNQSARHRQLSALAGQQAQQCGVEIPQLLNRAREALRQELSLTQRDYLQAQIQEAIRAVPEQMPDHEFAELVMAMQDQAIGLDFGERPQNQSRNTLYDLLHSRLVSQAMQVASRFANWIGDLIDRPKMGVDAARIAAEAGRECVRDLIGALAKEIHQLQGQQTHSRITLSTPLSPEETAKSGRGWLMRRSQPRVAITERLIVHGESSFEELLNVLVQSQLRSIEALLSTIIDQLLNMWQELKQLGKQLGHESDATQTEAGVPSAYEQSLRNWLVNHRLRLVQELRTRIEKDVLTGPKKLQRYLQQSGSYDHTLGLPLRVHSRRIVLQSMQQVLCNVLQVQASRLEDSDLQIDTALGEILNEPWALSGGAPQSVVMVVPAETGETSYQLRSSDRTVAIPMVAARTNSVAICRECRQASIPSVIHEITHGQSSLVAVAANLHTRIDVAWDSNPSCGDTPFAVNQNPTPSEWAEVQQTVPLG